MAEQTYALRPYRDSDAEALARIIKAAIAEIGPRAYSDEQVAAWSSRHPGPDAFRERVTDGCIILVAAGEDNEPVAYALLEADGHLDHLYTDPDHTQRGLAIQLLSATEEIARAQGVPRLYTEASDLARPAFERAGYLVTHKREFSIMHRKRAVPIHNWAMEKRLR